MKKTITLFVGTLLVCTSYLANAQCELPVTPKPYVVDCEPEWICRIPLRLDDIDEDINNNESEVITQFLLIDPEPQVINVNDDKVYCSHCLKPIRQEETGNTVKEKTKEPQWIGGCKEPQIKEPFSACNVLGCETHLLKNVLLESRTEKCAIKNPEPPAYIECRFVPTDDLTKSIDNNINQPFICGLSFQNYQAVQDEIKPEPTSIMGEDWLEYCLRCSKPLNSDKAVVIFTSVKSEVKKSQQLLDVDGRMLIDCQVPNFKCTEAVMERTVDIRPHVDCAHPYQTGIHSNVIMNEIIISVDNNEWCSCDVDEEEAIAEIEQEWCTCEFLIEEIEEPDMIEDLLLIIDEPIELKTFEVIEERIEIISCCLGSYSVVCDELIVAEPIEIIEEVDEVIEVLDIAEEVINPVSVSAYPNPFMEKAVLRINNYNNEPYTVSVVDATGKVVDFSRNQTQASYTFDGSNLHAGIYFYTIVSDSQNFKTSGRLVMQ